MKKKSLIILCVLLMAISLTACKGKVKRIESKDEVTEDKQEETINGYTEEELEKSTLPEDVLDKEESQDNTSSELTEEDVESALEEITENYSGGGPIILPEDVLEWKIKQLHVL